MAAVQFWQGSILFSGGAVAMDPSCCCNNTPTDASCCCEGLLTTSVPTALSLTLASTCARLDGQVIALSLTGQQGSGCRTWTGQLTLTCISVVTLSFYLFCDFDAAATSTPCRRYRLTVLPNSSACNASVYATYNADLDCSCDPLVLSFTGMVVPYDDPVHGGGNCVCCDPVDTFDATVTV